MLQEVRGELDRGDEIAGRTGQLGFGDSSPCARRERMPLAVAAAPRLVERQGRPPPGRPLRGAGEHQRRPGTSGSGHLARRPVGATAWVDDGRTPPSASVPAADRARRLGEPRPPRCARATPSRRLGRSPRGRDGSFSMRRRAIHAVPLGVVVGEETVGGGHGVTGAPEILPGVRATRAGAADPARAGRRSSRGRP